MAPAWPGCDVLLVKTGWGNASSEYDRLGQSPNRERLEFFIGGTKTVRVLLVNPKLDFAFWKMTFLTEITGTKALLPPLGLITVAAILPQDWEFRLVDLNTRKLTQDDWDWAELVAISGTLVHRRAVLSIVGEARQRRKMSVAGGPYASSLAEEVLAAGADYVVRGEGEITIPQLLSALKEGRNRCVIENQMKPEMSESPIPRFDLLNLQDYAAMGIQASRGCPHDCEFCDVVSLFGRKVRHKSPDQIIDELQTLYGLGWRGVVFITDDNFIGQRKNALAILQKMLPWSKARREPFTFWTQTSVGLGQDIEMIDLMTSANFTDVFVGIESLDADVLSTAGKLQNIRQPMASQLATIKKNGLSVVASFIIGLDAEKPGTGSLISQFVEQNDIPRVMLWPLGVLPRTPLWHRLKREGRLADDPIPKVLETARLNYIPTRAEKEIFAEFVSAWEDIYNPSRYLARASRYFLAMRPTREALGIKDAATQHEVSTSPSQLSLRRRLYLAVLALRLLWWQGVIRPTRLQFWRQLRHMYNNNPSRLSSYMNTCAFGENMFRMTPEIRNKFGQELD